MKALRISSLAILLAAMPITEAAVEVRGIPSSSCPNDTGHRPDVSELKSLLKAHKEWLRAQSWPSLVAAQPWDILRSDPHLATDWLLEQRRLGMPSFCNLDLHEDNFALLPMRNAFEGADLRGADLRGTDLSNIVLLGVKLDYAFLGGAKLITTAIEDVSLKGADLRSADLQDATIGNSDLEQANLHGALLTRATLRNSSLRRTQIRETDLSNARLSNIDLENATLEEVDMTRAVLQHTSLKGAILRSIILRGSTLVDVGLNSASLRSIQLKEAIIYDSDLSKSTFSDVDLSDAMLKNTSIEGGRLKFVNFTNLNYEPDGLPSKEGIGHILGLQTVTISPGKYASLTRLTVLFKEIGLRPLERRARFALEHNRTAHMMEGWHYDKSQVVFPYAPPSFEYEIHNKDLRSRIEGVLRLIFLEWTVGYGLHYERPILIVLGLMVLLAPIYLLPITWPNLFGRKSGVYRIWSQGRIEQVDKKLVVADSENVEQMSATGFRALAYAMLFSITSAFHIGWREVNVANWIYRLRSKEYVLRGRGWVRTVSGAQSLISVFMIAMWALTYFGSPFE